MDGERDKKEKVNVWDSTSHSISQIQCGGKEIGGERERESEGGGGEEKEEKTRQ